MAFHGSGFLATLHLTFIKNLTNETRLLLSFSVIFWFKEIKGLRKTKSRFGVNHVGGKWAGARQLFKVLCPVAG